HFERGGRADRAVGGYLRAAQQALEGNDFAAAIARADRGIGCGAAGSVLGELLLVKAEAHAWRHENTESTRFAREAMELLPRGSAAWYAAVGDLSAALGKLGRVDDLVSIAETLLEGPSNIDPEASGEVVALFKAIVQLVHAGQYDIAGRLFERLGGAEPIEPSTLRAPTESASMP